MITRKGRSLVSVLCIFAVLMTGIVLVTESSDANTYCAKIGNQGYTSFNEAITAANTMSGQVTVEIYGTVDYSTTTANLTGSYDKITFIGKTADAKISITRNSSAGYISGNDNGTPKVAFQDLILSKPVGEYRSDAGFMNVYFTVYRTGDVTYTNCTFPNGACTQGTTTTYSHCTFNGGNGNYGLWVYANTTCTVDDCDFIGARGIKMYSESVTDNNADRDNHLIVRDTRFHEEVTEKPAIVLTFGGSIELENNNYPSTGVLYLDKHQSNDYCNGTEIRSDVKDLVCVYKDSTGENQPYGVLVENADGITRIYRQIVDVNENNAGNGSVVTLLYDTVNAGEYSLPQGVTLDINGHYAGNITADIVIDSTVKPEEPEDYPFFPGQGTNVGPQDSGSEDNTKLVAAAAAIVVIMLAVVAIMVTKKD